MIVPDINLLLYAYSAGAPQHAKARRWWEGLLNDDEPVAVPWAVVLGFLRLITHPRVMQTPMDPSVAFANIRSWFQRPHVEHLEPGPRHLELLEEMTNASGTVGNLTTDAHLAAFAIEHQCELHSNDADFARFPGLRWRNPLKENP